MENIAAEKAGIKSTALVAAYEPVPHTKGRERWPKVKKKSIALNARELVIVFIAVPRSNTKSTVTTIM
ncbi:hypothetical protein [Pontiella sulfatireligans]|uniref:hypothetical protein n=1 Tax=Pontiella sulfatireligans TaxID=2750658 RepID=UPI00109C3688|nr:hypothetical protein [Pontiella sulfatireligans]